MTIKLNGNILFLILILSFYCNDKTQAAVVGNSIVKPNNHKAIQLAVETTNSIIAIEEDEERIEPLQPDLIATTVFTQKNEIEFSSANIIATRNLSLLKAGPNVLLKLFCILRL